MRSFEGRAWIARAVASPLGPILVVTDAGECHVNLEPAAETIDGRSIPGSRARVRFDEPDDHWPDDRIFDRARDLAVAAVNRVVHVAVHVSGHHVIAPALEARDLIAFRVEEVAPATRVLADRPLEVRAPLIPGSGLDARVQRHVNPSASLNDAEVRWLDALDAACAGRTREAVVAARASVEIAWLDTVTAASAQHRAISPASVHPVIDAYLALANEGRRSIHDKLGDYSLKILGVSFVATWQARGRWKDLLDAFTTRNDAAHGRASITPARAAQIVALMRELLDEIAVERAKYP